MTFQTILTKCLRHDVKVLLPYTCILCGSASQQDLDLCCDCEADLPLIENACQQCAIPLDAEQDLLCAQCQNKPPAFHRSFALFHYNPPIDGFIMDLKFHHKLLYAHILGKLLLKKINNCDKPEYIIPVPLHPKRLRQRGFNQALEIAKPIANALQIPIETQSIKRIENTDSQSQIDASKRQKNLKNAFEVVEPIQARHVAIVDDVVTTGSTVNALATKLVEQGVKQIDVWCSARTSLKPSIHR